MQANFWEEVDDVKKFDVDIFGIQSGEHHYEFKIDDSFFQEFENSLIEKGSLRCRVVLKKTERLIKADFKIFGDVQLVCDRCLEPFDHHIEIEEQLIFKYGSEEEELDSNIYTITTSTQRLKFGQPIFEIISVAVPMKKLHPRFAEEENENDGGIFYSSSEKRGSEQDNEESDMDYIDPRWEALKKLKNNIK